MLLIDSLGIEFINQPAPLRAIHPTGGANYSALGQSFTVSVGGCKLVSAVFPMSRDFFANGVMNAVLYAHSGVYGTSSLPTGNPLATSDDVNASLLNINYNYGLVTFTFSGTQQFELIKGTKYVITVQATSGTWDVASNFVALGFDNGGQLDHRGNLYGFLNGSWTPYTNDDACFYIYGTPITNVNVAEGAEIPSTASAPITDCGGTRVRVVRHLTTLTPLVI